MVLAAASIRRTFALPGTEVDTFGSMASSRGTTLGPSTSATQAPTPSNLSASTSRANNIPIPAADRPQAQPIATATSNGDMINDNGFLGAATGEVGIDRSVDEIGEERAPIASTVEEREWWDNGEPVTKAQREKVLALESDYEKSKEMNKIQNLRLVEQLGLEKGFKDLFRSRNKARKALSDSDGYGDDDDDDEDLSGAVDPVSPRLTRR